MIYQKWTSFFLLVCILLSLGLAGCTSGTASIGPAGTTTAASTAVTTTTTAATTPVPTETTTTISTTPAEITTLAVEVDEVPASWENLSWMKDTSPIKFSVFVNYSWYTLLKQEGIDDPISQEITKLTGVTLDVYRAAASSEYLMEGEKDLNTMLASEELTDFVFTGDEAASLFYDTKLAHAWDILIPQYCPELWKLVEPMEILNNIADDGHVYTFKTLYKGEKFYNDDQSLYDCGNFALAYRADILKRMGLEPFTSVEAMEDTFYAVKEHADEFGITTVYDPLGYDETNILYYWMGCQVGNIWDEESKRIKTQYTDTQWLDYFKTMNRWYRDGILASSYVTSDGNDIYQRTNSTGTFALSGTAYDGDETNRQWRTQMIGGKIDELNLPVYQTVTQHLTYENNLQIQLSDYSTGVDSLFITTACHDPARAICFVEFLRSPQGDTLTNWGIEGLHYEMTDQGTFIRPEAYSTLNTNDGVTSWAFQESAWSTGVRITSNYYINAEQDEYWTNERINQNIQRLANKHLMSQNRNQVISYARIEAQDPEYDNYQKIVALWNKSGKEMIAAETEAQVEHLYTQLQHELTLLGIESVEDRMTERFLWHLQLYQDAGYYQDINAQ